MLLKTLYWMHLTDLTRDEVDQYESAIRSGARIEERGKVRLWGSIALLLCALLVVSALGTVSMLKTLYSISDLQTKVSDLDRTATLEPVEVTRGPGDESDPARVLQRVRERTQKIQQELDALRLKSIDYSSLGEQRKRIAELDRELRQLSAKATDARKKLDAESPEPGPAQAARPLA